MLEVYGIHKLIAEEGAPLKVQHIGSAAGSDLPERLTEILEAFAQSMIDRQQALGKAQSAWWADSQPPEEIRELMDCSISEFDKATRAAMERLLTSTPGTADGGVMVFVRANEDGASKLLCLKLALSDISLERLTDALSASEAIEREDITNVLPKADDLRKAALIPHPSESADLKVVDEQTKGPKGTADYWLRFLGAHVGIKEPDVGRLIAAVAVPVLKQQGVKNPEALVGDELRKVAAASKPTSVRKFIEEIAETAKKPSSAIWSGVSEKEPKLVAPRVQVTPAAAQRVVTVIELSNGVTVRGLSTALEGRYETIDDPESDGWLLQIKTSLRPKVTHSAKRGQISE